jgi:AcrR family transcriptional regulator
MSVAEKKMYRNAIRSRQMIRSAFLELLREKPCEKITATDIIQRADINRSTFYAHYPDVRGIMDEIMAEITQMFRNMLQSVDFTAFFEDPVPILREVMEFVRQNQEMYQILLQYNVALEQLEQLKKVLIAQVLEIPNLPVQNQGSVGVAIRVRMLISGLVDTYRQWLEGELNCTLEETVEEVAEEVAEEVEEVLFLLTFLEIAVTVYSAITRTPNRTAQ